MPKLKVDIDLQLKVQEVAPVDVDDRDLTSSSSSDDESSSSSSQDSAEESDGERAGLADNALSFLICPSRQFLRALARHAKLRF